MKTYNVFTHYEVPAVKVKATNKSEALEKGLAMAAQNPPIIRGYYVPHPVDNWIPPRAATPLEDPFACIA